MTEKRKQPIARGGLGRSPFPRINHRDVAMGFAPAINREPEERDER